MNPNSEFNLQSELTAGTLVELLHQLSGLHRIISLFVLKSIINCNSCDALLTLDTHRFNSLTQYLYGCEADCCAAEEQKETLTCLERLSLLQSKSYLQRQRREDTTRQCGGKGRDRK